MWLQQLLKDLGLTTLHPTSIKCDNKAILSIVANPIHHERIKHVDMDCYFIREKQATGVIKTEYMPSKHQLADIFTKQLPVLQHHQLLVKLGVLPQAPSPA